MYILCTPYTLAVAAHVYVRSSSTRETYGRSGIAEAAVACYLCRVECGFADVIFRRTYKYNVHSLGLAGCRRQRSCQEIYCEWRDVGRPTPRRATRDTFSTADAAAAVAEGGCMLGKTGREEDPLTSCL